MGRRAYKGVPPRRAALGALDHRVGEFTDIGAIHSNMLIDIETEAGGQVVFDDQGDGDVLKGPLGLYRRAPMIESDPDGARNAQGGLKVIFDAAGEDVLVPP